MNEEFEDYFGDKDIFQIINRYKEMMESNTPCFFDVCDYEDIIDFYIDQENLTRAIEAAKVGIKNFPFATSLKLKYAKILDEKGLTGKAMAVISEIENHESFNHEFHLVKGNSLVRQGNHKEAYKEFDQAIRLCCANRDELVYEISLSFLNSGNENIALKYLLLAHEINEKNLLVIYELASCYEGMERWEDAIFYYEKFLDLEPFSENIWYSIGHSFSKIEKDEKAIEAYDYALALNPCYNSAVFAKGELLARQGKYKESIELYSEVIDYDATNLKAICFIGDCYNKMGQTSIALDYFRKAKAIDRSYPKTWYGIALVYKNLNKYNICLINLQKAIKLDKTNADYWFLLGIIYREINQKAGAIDAFEQATKFDPMNIDAWLAYADILHENKKTQDAIELLTKAYQFNYDISAVNYKLAVYYTFNNQYLLAKEYFEKGLVLNYKEHSKYLNEVLRSENSEDIERLLKKYQ